MKMIKKDELEFIGGYLVHGDDIIGVDPKIVEQVNKLETLVQKRNWLSLQPKACSGPDFNSFERMHDNDVVIHANPTTPMLDSMTEESLKLMEEIDRQNEADTANKIFEKLQDLTEFAINDYVIDSEQYSIKKFDLPMIGNPLDITVDKICEWVCYGMGIESSVNIDE